MTIESATTGDRAPTSGRTTRAVAGGGALLTAAMAVSGVGNYAINALYARWLTPAEFGDASLLVTLLLVVTAAAGCFQLVMARCAGAANDDPGRLAATRRRLLRAAWFGGIGVASITALCRAPAADAFNLDDSAALVVFALGIPLHLAQAVDRGVLQGRLAFRRLSGSFVVEMLSRLLVSVALVATGWGLLGVAIALWASLFAAFVAARLAVGPLPDVGARPARLASVIGATTVLLVAQIAISHGDLLLVKQRFDPVDAGSYAVVALLGRAVFTVSWSVVAAAFPAGAGLASDPRALRSIVVGGLAVLGSGGTFAVVGSWLLADSLIPLLFTDAYAGAGSLLGPYVLATVLLTLANFLAMIDLARGRYRRTAVLVAGAVLQTALIVRGDDLAAVVWAQVVAMALTLLTMAVAGSGPAAGTGRGSAPVSVRGRRTPVGSRSRCRVGRG